MRRGGEGGAEGGAESDTGTGRRIKSADRITFLHVRKRNGKIEGGKQRRKQNFLPKIGRKQE
ncbi:UNVERIFIED_ORG: hypothetical protein B5F06_11850 [Lacrimispora saccharolytica]